MDQAVIEAIFLPQRSDHFGRSTAHLARDDLHGIARGEMDHEEIEHNDREQEADSIHNLTKQM
jgi:hypothetical protein